MRAGRTWSEVRLAQGGRWRGADVRCEERRKRTELTRLKAIRFVISEVKSQLTELLGDWAGWRRE